MQYAMRLEFCNHDDRSTNNVTEYDALLLGLRKARALGAQRFVVMTDSKVVADQMEKECLAKKLELIKYLAVVRSFVKKKLRGLLLSISQGSKMTKLTRWQRLWPKTTI